MKKCRVHSLKGTLCTLSKRIPWFWDLDNTWIRNIYICAGSATGSTSSQSAGVFNADLIMSSAPSSAKQRLGIKRPASQTVTVNLSSEPKQSRLGLCMFASFLCRTAMKRLVWCRVSRLTSWPVFGDPCSNRSHDGALSCTVFIHSDLVPLCEITEMPVSACVSTGHSIS